MEAALKRWHLGWSLEGEQDLGERDVRQNTPDKWTSKWRAVRQSTLAFLCTSQCWFRSSRKVAEKDISLPVWTQLISEALVRNSESIDRFLCFISYFISLYASALCFLGGYSMLLKLFTALKGALPHTHTACSYLKLLRCERWNAQACLKNSDAHWIQFHNLQKTCHLGE